MRKSIGVSRFLPRRGVHLAAGVVATAIASQANAYTTANLLTDPSFESNPLIANYANIIGPPFTTNVWGAEVGTISGTNDGINPASGVLMLGMDDDGLSATQGWQLVSVAAYTADINAGAATIDASALFNVPAAVAAGQSSLNVSFQDAAHNPLGNVGLGSGALDTSTATWQPINITSAAVPVNTQFLLLQVAYNNATMVDINGVRRRGYVDDASLTLTAPEPGTLALAGAALGLMVLRRRRVVE